MNSVEKFINKEQTENSLEEIAERNFQNWNQLLQTGNEEEVAGIYLPKGELFGTVSGKIRQGRNEIAGYFEHFLQSNPVGKILEREVVSIDENTYLDQGVYEFTLQQDNGREKKVQANFTYVWQKDENGDWKILHHHSAAISQENIQLSTQDEIELYDFSKREDFQNGLGVDFGNGYFLKTGFVKQDNQVVRMTYLLKKTEGKEKVVSRQVSYVADNAFDIEL